MMPFIKEADRTKASDGMRPSSKGHQGGSRPGIRQPPIGRSRAMSAAGASQGGGGLIDEDGIEMTRPYTSMSLDALDQTFATTMSMNAGSVSQLKEEMERLKEREAHRAQDLMLGLQDSAMWYMKRNMPKAGDPNQGKSIRKDGTINKPMALFKGVAKVALAGAKIRLKREQDERELKEKQAQEEARIKWEQQQEEEKKGDGLQRALKGETEDRIRLQKDWLHKREIERTKQLLECRTHWAEQYEENVQWPYKIKALKAQIDNTRRASKTAIGVIAELASESRVIVRTSQIAGGATGVIVTKRDLEGAMATLSKDVEAMHLYNRENDVHFLRRLKEINDSEIERLKSNLTVLIEQDRQVLWELKEQRSILKTALAPWVLDRRNRQFSWHELMEREKINTQAAIEEQEGYKKAKFAEAEDTRRMVFAKRVEVNQQLDVVAGVDAQIAELEQQKIAQLSEHQVEVNKHKGTIRKQLAGLRTTRGFKKNFEDKRPERERFRDEKKARIQELEAREAELRKALNEEAGRVKRFRLAALAAAMRLPRIKAVDDEYDRMQQEEDEGKEADQKELDTMMKIYFAQLPQDEEVDFEAAKSWVHVRMPLLAVHKAEVDAMLDKAFDAAFGDDDKDPDEEAKKKAIMQELLEYGMMPEEFRGMGLAQLKMLLEEEKKLAAGGDAEEAESSSEEEEEEEEPQKDEEPQESEEEAQRRRKQEEEEALLLANAPVPDMIDEDEDEKRLAAMKKRKAEEDRRKAEAAKAESSDSDEDQDKKNAIQQAIEEAEKEAEKAAAALKW